MGRHGAPRARRRLGLALSASGLAGLALVGWRVFPAAQSAEPAAAASPSAVPSATCAASPALDLITTPAMAPVVQEVITNLKPACATWTVKAESAQVTLTAFTSGKRPAVWIPDSSMLSAQVASLGGVSVADPIATTPIVAAVPAGQALPKAMDWATFLTADNVRIPDPAYSTVGTLASMGAVRQVLALPDPQRTFALAGVGTLLRHVVPVADVFGKYSHPGTAAIFPATEQEIASAKVAGMTVRATDATNPLDYPVVASGAEHKAAADALRAALTSKAGAAVLRAHNFRTTLDPSPFLPGAPTTLAYVATPTPAEQVQSADMWQTIIKPSRLLAVIDVSGSMKNPVGTSTVTRIATAAQAATTAAQVLPEKDSFGLWVFSSNQRGKIDWRELSALVPLGPGGHRAAVQQQLTRVPTLLGGDTGLYDTIAAAYDAMQASYDPASTNTIVLFTDGANRDPSGGLSLAELSAHIKTKADPKRPITLVLIGMGEADRSALRQVAAALPKVGNTGGAVFDIRKPEDITGIYAALVLGPVAVR